MMKQILLILAISIYGFSTEKVSDQWIKEYSKISLIEQESHYDSFSTIDCNHSNLSGQFDIRVHFERHTSIKERHDSCVVELFLSEKNTQKATDTLSIRSHFYFKDVFIDCSNVLSYSTEVNVDKAIVDNNYGDIIIADLNFDKKDDIVIINNSGGNGGVLYSYFIQSEDNRFILDSFLTDSMTYFPAKIDVQNRTLVTYVPAGVCGLAEHIFQLHTESYIWTEKSHRIINICEE